MLKNNLFKKNIWLKLLAVFVLLIFFHYTQILRPVEDFISYLFLPLQAELYEKGFSARQIWDGAVLNKKELVYQNQALEKQVQDLLVDQSHLLDIEAENKTLRQQLNFLENKTYKYTVARVIGSNFNNNIYSYILNKGSEAGLHKGQAVIFGDGIIVGKIYQVFPQQSELLLLSDNRSAIAAVVQNKDLSQGIVGGQYGLTMKMNFIPQNEQLSPNDIIITSGLEDLIPRGLVIGKISQVEAAVNDLFQQAVILPAIDYSKINLVTVITGWEDKK